jgi:uncharacterized cupin superfamily protein
MKKPKRPDYIRHWREIETPVKPPVVEETFGYASEFSPAVGLTHLRTAHFRLEPGQRAYPPVAMRDDEVFFMVLEGTPDLWIDGNLYRLKEGDCGALLARTGIAHTILNNSDSQVRLFALTEAPRLSSRAVHPIDGTANDNLKKMGRLWADAPKRKLGPHDGLTDKQRGKGSRARKSRKPHFVIHWLDILEKKPLLYPKSDEPNGYRARLGQTARFSRVGVNVQLLKPGQRSSWPHAERDEEEFVFLVSGKLDAWNDGFITPMGEGEIIGWEAGTGMTHVLINNSDEDAVLLSGSEASRVRNQYWYTFHQQYNREIRSAYWADHPVPKLGPHDGLPDALRARVPARFRRSAVSANEAAQNLGKLKR